MGSCLPPRQDGDGARRSTDEAAFTANASRGTSHKHFGHFGRSTRKRNAIGQWIAEVIGRPALIGHVGEFIASGEFTSEPFEDDTPIFGPGQPYPRRCKVKFEESGFGRPVGECLWYLSAFTSMEMKTSPTNYLRCYGGFMEISVEDYDWLLEVMAGTWTPETAGSPAG